MLSMVDLHGRLIDMGLKGVVCVRKSGKGMGHGDVCCEDSGVEGGKIAGSISGERYMDSRKVYFRPHFHQKQDRK